MTKSEKKSGKKGIFFTMGALATLGVLTVWKKGKNAVNNVVQKCKSTFKGNTM